MDETNFQNMFQKFSKQSSKGTLHEDTKTTNDESEGIQDSGNTNNESEGQKFKINIKKEELGDDDCEDKQLDAPHVIYNIIKQEDEDASDDHHDDSPHRDDHHDDSSHRDNHHDNGSHRDDHHADGPHRDDHHADGPHRDDHHGDGPHRDSMRPKSIDSPDNNDDMPYQQTEVKQEVMTIHCSDSLGNDLGSHQFKQEFTNFSGPKEDSGGQNQNFLEPEIKIDVEERSDLPDSSAIVHVHSFLMHDDLSGAEASLAEPSSSFHCDDEIKQMSDHQKIRKCKEVIFCNTCTYNTKSQNAIRRHMMAVHNNGHPFSCDKCSYSAGRNGTLQRHIRTVHNKEKPYLCGKCSHCAGSNGDLQRHIRTVHNKEKNFFCDKCSYSAGRNGTLQHHIRTVHNKEKPYSCSKCSYTAGQQAHIHHHIKTVHNKEKPFNCDACSHSAGTNADLQRHIRTMHNK